MAAASADCFRYRTPGIFRYVRRNLSMRRRLNVTNGEMD
jgi:hypothetical protein